MRSNEELSLHPLPSAGDGPSARKEAIIALARATPGGATTERYQAVEAAISAGKIAGPMPSVTTFWRWLKQAGVLDSAPTSVPTGAGTSLASLTNKHEDQSWTEKARAKNREALDRTQARLRDCMQRLDEKGQRLHSRAMNRLHKRIDKARKKNHFGRLLSELLEDCAYLERKVAADTAVQQVRIESQSTPANVEAAAEPSLAVIAPDLAQDPHHLPVFRKPGEHTPVQRIEEPAGLPEYGVRIGTFAGGAIQPDAAERKAMVRATLLQPVFTGELTPERAARAWRHVLEHGECDEHNPDTHALSLAVKDWDHATRFKYVELTDRTMQRWMERVREDWNESDELSLPRRSVAQILVHKREVAGRPRVATSSVQLQVLSLMKEQKNWNASLIAAYLSKINGSPISLRTVYRIMGEHLSAVERTDARGGVAVDDVLWRRRYERESVEPNHCWMMDHTWVRQEITGGRLPEEHADCPFPISVRYQNGQGEWLVQRGVHVTVVLDAHTRRVLAARVWLKAPDTRSTLLALRTAFERFGAPRILYTDNGSDLCSKAIKHILQFAGIHKVESIPYTPQGRGRVERFFRTLKSSILPALAGYYGGRHEHHWEPNELLSVEEFERLLNTGIETLYNQMKHGTTGYKPTEHWERCVGELGKKDVLMRAVTAEGKFALFLTQPGVKLGSMGFSLLNNRYYMAGAHNVPNGAHVVVHFDPDKMDVVFVSVPGAGTSLTYVGHAVRYDSKSPPPDFIEASRQHAQWVRERQAAVSASTSTRTLYAAEIESLANGLEIANTVYGEVERAAAPAARHVALLSPPAPSGPVPNTLISSHDKQPPAAVEQLEVQILGDEVPWE